MAAAVRALGGWRPSIGQAGGRDVKCQRGQGAAATRGGSGVAQAFRDSNKSRQHAHAVMGDPGTQPASRARIQYCWHTTPRMHHARGQPLVVGSPLLVRHPSLTYHHTIYKDLL